jgi:hypothetical protein
MQFLIRNAAKNLKFAQKEKGRTFRRPFPFFVHAFLNVFQFAKA